MFLPLVSSQIVSRIYLRQSRHGPIGLLRRIFDLWLGISPILLGELLLAEIYVLIFNPDTIIVAWCLIGLSLLIGALGFVNAQFPVVRKVRLESSKVSRPMRFVQISDVHIGSRTSGFLDRVMRQINRLDADFLCITGDFIDASGVTETELASLKSYTGKIYFCIGNHEKYEDLDAITQRLSNLGVTVLRNQSVIDGNVQFIGIDDMDDALQVSRQIAKVTIEHENFVILLYHRPRGLRAAADSGVDLMLSGHTHNGQIVPFNLIVARVFAKTRGLYQRGKTSLYVSTGTGTWGPIMRIGTRSEITLFEIIPA